MAGDERGDQVPTTGRADGPYRSRLACPFGQFGVGSGLAGGDRPQPVPDRLLQLGAGLADGDLAECADLAPEVAQDRTVQRPEPAAAVAQAAGGQKPAATTTVSPSTPSARTVRSPTGVG